LGGDPQADRQIPHDDCRRSQVFSAGAGGYFRAIHQESHIQGFENAQQERGSEASPHSGYEEEAAGFCQKIQRLDP
jgi:hypothetical protein